MNCTHFVKQPNLKLKTRPKQLLGFLPLAFELPASAHLWVSEGIREERKKERVRKEFLVCKVGIRVELRKLSISSAETRVPGEKDATTLSMTTQYNDIQHNNK
jgi:hypothetical protein